ncbi:MAG TPA: hypothetical protein VKH81_19765 [Candidatus Angelobacter sp.]|nr:hypothetical protein [Candidatus Angelobacter sp.]
MANVTAGPTTGLPAKKETVYSGPAPQTQGTVYNGPSPAMSGGTVYNGPALTPNAGGTVYGGPAQGSLAPGSTVYRTPRPAGLDKSAVHPGAAKGAGIFFAIAVYSAINSVLVASGSPIVLGGGLTTSKVAAPGQMTGIIVVNVLVIGVFVLLGIFARQGSKAAFVIGMLLWGSDLALLLLSPNAAAHVGGLVVHVFFLIGLFKGFSQLSS